LERKISAAHAGTADRLHARDAGAFFDHAGTKALHLGIVAPRLAFGKEHAAATRQHAENAKDDGAYKILTQSPRHAGRMRWFLLTFLQRLPRPSEHSSTRHAMVKNEDGFHFAQPLMVCMVTLLVTFLDIGLRSDLD